MRKLFVLVLVVFAISVKSQIKSGGSYKDYFSEGSYLLLEDNYPMAQDNFEAAYQIDSSSANINYLIGICYLHSATQKANAESHLAKAIKNVSKSYKTDNAAEKAAPPLAYYFYGQALHINYKFDAATEQYNNFAKYVSATDKDWKKSLNRERATCAYAKETVASPFNIQITNLGDSVNSQYPDYSPVLSADERMIIYTTRRPNTTGGLKDLNGYYNEDIVVSYKNEEGNWSTPVPISNNINTGGMEASINLSIDGQTLIMYKDAGDGLSGNIYYSTYDGKDWSLLKEFGSDVNTKYQETHACLSADGNLLFIVSDRPGGYGGKDIYRCVKLPNGKWSKALNMGPTINTEYDEDGAFIHPDGKTFFFASKGHKTIGGYDIMFATLDEDNKFSDVLNIGYPINTTDDDVFYVTSPDGKRAYFSSAKEGGNGEKDIYMLSIPDSKEKPLALFIGQIIPAEGEKLPDDIVIVVTDKQTGEIVGNYRPKMINGTFSTILPPGREYNFSYEANGEEFYNEDVFVTNDLSYQEIKRDVRLEPVKLLGKVKAKQKSIILNTIVLDNSKSKKAVPNAKLTLTEVGGNPQNFDANALGRHDGVALQAEKKYTLFAEAEGKKSAIAEISTMAPKSGKIINQILYINGKPEKVISKDIILAVKVKDNKTKKAISNANITLTDADGNRTEGVTNEKGVAKDIELIADTKYDLIATNDGAVSEKISFNTNGIKGAKKITKTLLIGSEKPPVTAENTDDGTSTADLPPSRYAFFFKYNKNNNDDDVIWNAFIDNVIALSKSKEFVKIAISSSASNVPTRAFRNNKQLAASRAKKLQKRIDEAVAAKGGDISKLRYTRNPMVNGPKYKGDAVMGRAKYERHQYVKARAK